MQGLGSIIPLILMFVLFYFLLIRPQQKRTKAVQQMQNELKKVIKLSRLAVYMVLSIQSMKAKS